MRQVSGHPGAEAILIVPGFLLAIVPLNLGGGGARPSAPARIAAKESGVKCEGAASGFASVKSQPASANSASAFDVGEVR